MNHISFTCLHLQIFFISQNSSPSLESFILRLPLGRGAKSSGMFCKACQAVDFCLHLPEVSGWRTEEVSTCRKVPGHQLQVTDTTWLVRARKRSWGSTFRFDQKSFFYFLSWLIILSQTIPNSIIYNLKPRYFHLFLTFYVEIVPDLHKHCKNSTNNSLSPDVLYVNIYYICFIIFPHSFLFGF